MSFLFKRYSAPSRRAIFYAREAALHAGASQIDSMHLLSGLTLEQNSRANLSFKLGERFPEEAARMRALKWASDQKDIPLAHDGKRVLAYAEDEANNLESYWIDTDHLVLGILRERKCAAAARLEESGLSIAEARRLVESPSEPREIYGPIPALWQLSKPITRVGRAAGMFYVLIVVLLIMFLAGKGC